MSRIAVFGARGFVGSALSRAFTAAGHEVACVSRSNFAEQLGQSYEIVVNAAHPAARYWASKNPADDFRETVQKTADIYYGCRFSKFVQISSLSARCQLSTVYGRHKLAAEAVVNDGNSAIFRLTSMFGPGLQKGVLVDLLHNRQVFVHPLSRYAFASVDFIAAYVMKNLHRTGVVEVGSHNSLAAGDIATHLGSTSTFGDVLDIQEVENVDDALPDAREVFAFLDALQRPGQVP